jgi:hypothetical protein
MNEYEVTQANATVLANAVELGAAVIASLAGNAIANSIDGQPADDLYLKTAIAAKINSTLIPHLGAQ